MRRRDINVEPCVLSSPSVTTGVTKTISYENNTGQPVYVTEASGSHFILYPNPNVNARFGIIVNVTYAASRGRGCLSGLAEGVPDKVYNSIQESLFKDGRATLSYVIDDLSALLRGELLVVKKLGIAISTNPIKMDETPTVTPGFHRTELTLSVVVVQNDPDAPEFTHLRFYSTLCRIKPVSSTFYKEGIYLIIGGGEIVEDSGLIHFSFGDQQSPFKAFTDEGSAMRWRWAESIFELSELKQKLSREHNSALTNLEAVKDKLELEAKRQQQELTVEKERALSLLKRREVELKERADLRKDFYEGRSYHRKDTTETIKLLPAFMTAAAAVVGLLI